MVFDLFFPSRCPGCGHVGASLCDRCRSTLVPEPDVPRVDVVESLAAAVAYNAVAASIVKAAKFARHRDALGPAASMVAAISPIDCHVVTWVPTTPARRRIRGADIARELAHGVAAELGLDCRATMRRLDRSSQTGASRRERLAGPSFVGRLRLDGCRVLLIDDVTTTGATLGAAGRTLMQAGAASVHARTFAATIYDRYTRASAGVGQRAWSSHGRTDQLPPP